MDKVGLILEGGGMRGIYTAGVLDCFIDLSFRNLIKTGSIFGMDLMFNKIPNELYPYDYETFNKSKSKFTVVATNCETGEAEYFQLKDMKKDIITMRN